MSVVVVTRTVMARPKHLAPFAWQSLRVGFQARRSPGYVAGAMRISRGWVFWTLTVWRDGRAMAAFRSSGVHGQVMPRLAGWASEGAFAAWRIPDEQLPSWAQAQDELHRHPSFTALDAPGVAHRAGVVREPVAVGLSVRVPGPHVTRRPPPR